MVGVAPNGEAGVRLVTELRPDVVVMDIRMPVMDGLAATRRIRSTPELHDARVLILTTFDLDEYVFGALRAGASGFLFEDVPVDEMRAAIRIVAAGEALLAPSVMRALIEEFVRRPEPAAATVAAARLPDLTPREVEILRPVAGGGCRTPRSPTGSSSVTAPSRRTSAACWASPSCATERSW